MSNTRETTVYSTTGTAPLRLVPSAGGREHVYIYLEDGSGQVYKVADLLAALGHEHREVVA